MTPTTPSLKDAAREQARLGRMVRIEPFEREPKVVAAVDAAYSDHQSMIFAVAVVLAHEGFELLESSLVAARTPFPYIPGFLSFREAPPLLRALGRLETPFEALLVDGQGIAHPRSVGLATHLGVLLGLPAIGCAKKRLVGDAAAPGAAKGSFSTLEVKGEPVGVVLRTRAGVKPVFVSPGHLVDVDSARRTVLDWVGRFRIPEPLRAAHNLAGKYSKGLAPLLARNP